MQAEHISDFRDMKKAAEQQGWRVERTNGSHWKFLPPQKALGIYIVSGTPRNPKCFVRKIRCDLMKLGLQIAA